MLCRALTLLLLAALGCAKQRPSIESGSVATVTPPSPPPSSATAVPRGTALSATVREVPFDGGVARIQAEAGDSEVVTLVASDGGVLGESHCVPPRAGYDAVSTFYQQVQAAVLGGDATEVAKFVAFPLRVNAARTRVIPNREQFVREWARIFTPAVRRAVQNADPGQVFCNSQGMMLGAGVLWAELENDERLAVWVVNVDAEPTGPKLGRK